MKTIVIAFLLVLLVGGAVLAYVGTPNAEDKAREAMKGAVYACGTNSRTEFDRRLVDAKLAIERVDLNKQEDLTAALENDLRLSGCPVQ